MQNKKRILLASACSLTAGICTFLMLLTILPGINSLEITARTDPAANFKLYYSNGLGEIHYNEFYFLKQIPFSSTTATKTRVFGLNYPNYLRLDTGDSAGVSRIYRIKLRSHFSPEKVLGPADIYRLFAPGNNEVRMTLKNDHVQIESSGNDPYILCRSRLFDFQWGKALGFGLAAGIMAYLFIFFLPCSTAGMKSIFLPAPEGKKRIRGFDGLRGLAMMMVVADHSWGFFRGTGASGVWIYFALSGFLLAAPFVQDKTRAYSIRYQAGYFSRRLQRIIPLYYLYLLLIFGTRGAYDTMAIHMVFLSGAGHLWAIPQFMLFYLLLPLLMFFSSALLQNKTALTIPFFVLVIFLSHHFLGKDVFGMLGMNGIRLRFFLEIFVWGILFSSVYFGIYQRYENHGIIKNILAPLCTATGSVIIIFFILLSTGHIFDNNVVFSQKYFGFYGFLAGLLIFCITASQNGLLTRVLESPIPRYIGIISFSFYLLHPQVFLFLNNLAIYYFGQHLSGWVLFLLTLLLSYPLACISYRFIENPGRTRPI